MVARLHPPDPARTPAFRLAQPRGACRGSAAPEVEERSSSRALAKIDSAEAREKEHQPRMMQDDADKPSLSVSSVLRGRCLFVVLRSFSAAATDHRPRDA